MSVLSDTLESDVNLITAAAWDSRDGSVVPETEDLKLGNDRVILDAVVLYADLADSTELALADQEAAAELFKAYLRGVSRIIRFHKGHIRSFDGDRVMGVFTGSYKNTSAAKCGLQINWFFRTLLSPRFLQQYSTLLAGITLNQTVGIDAGKIHVARAGVRNHNDLIWVGRAPNVAAKLSSIRNGKHNTFLTPTVYKALNEEAKLGGNPKREMWDLLNWTAGGKYSVPQIYGSSWTWKV